MEKATKISMLALVLIALINMAAYFSITRIHDEVKVANEHLRNIHGAEERRNSELTAERDCLRMPSRTPWPQPNPDDPICGDPSKLLTPTPEAHH